MSTVSMLQAHLEAAAAQVSVVETPVEQIKARTRRTYAFMGMAAAAVLVVIVAAAGLVRGNSDELISPPPIADGLLDASITELLPPSFDQTEALPVFSEMGDAVAVALAYLETRTGVEVAVVSVTELEGDLVAVRWGWGRIAGVTVSNDEGNLGWIVLRRSGDDGYDVIAATTDGVDLSDAALEAGQLSLFVRSSANDGFVVDVLDLDGAPIPGALHPEGLFPEGGMVFGTAGDAELVGPSGATDYRYVTEGVDGPVVVRVQLIGGTLLTVSEVVIGEAPAEPVPTTATPPEPTTPASSTTTSTPSHDMC